MPSKISTHIYIPAAALGFCKDVYHTATLSAVVAETIEPATRGIPMATACRCTRQQCGQTGGMPFQGGPNAEMTPYWDVTEDLKGLACAKASVWAFPR